MAVTTITDPTGVGDIQFNVYSGGNDTSLGIVAPIIAANIVGVFRRFSPAIAMTARNVQRRIANQQGEIFTIEVMQDMPDVIDLSTFTGDLTYHKYVKSAKQLPLDRRFCTTFQIDQLEMLLPFNYSPNSVWELYTTNAILPLIYRIEMDCMGAYPYFSNSMTATGTNGALVPNDFADAKTMLIDESCPGATAGVGLNSIISTYDYNSLVKNEDLTDMSKSGTTFPLYDSELPRLHSWAPAQSTFVEYTTQTTPYVKSYSNLFFHRDAIELAFKDLTLNSPQDFPGAQFIFIRDTATGVNVRLIISANVQGRDPVLQVKTEVWYGIGVFYPQFGINVTSSKTIS